MATGFHVVLEGFDGCGKSTHARLLARWLRSRGHDVVVTDEPTNGAFGRLIKMVLDGKLKLPTATEALLFAADRVDHVVNLISPSLKAGKIVLSERYVHSSMAYQSARGLPLEWIKKMNGYAPKPDLTILIDVPTEISMARIGSRRLDEFERDKGLQERVRRNYLRMAKRERLKVVDGSRAAGDVQADIRKLVSAAIEPAGRPCSMPRD